MVDRAQGLVREGVRVVVHPRPCQGYAAPAKELAGQNVKDALGAHGLGREGVSIGGDAGPDPGGYLAELVFAQTLSLVVGPQARHGRVNGEGVGQCIAQVYVLELPLLVVLRDDDVVAREEGRELGVHRLHLLRRRPGGGHRSADRGLRKDARHGHVGRETLRSLGPDRALERHGSLFAQPLADNVGQGEGHFLQATVHDVDRVADVLGGEGHEVTKDRELVQLAHGEAYAVVDREHVLDRVSRDDLQRGQLRVGQAGQALGKACGLHVFEDAHDRSAEPCVSKGLHELVLLGDHGHAFEEGVRVRVDPLEGAQEWDPTFGLADRVAQLA